MEVAQRPFCDWVQMMENSQLKLLFEISLFIRANNPFAMPISLNMDNIKKAAQLNYETHWRWSVCYSCVHVQYSWARCSDVAGIQSKADYYLKNRTGNWLNVTYLLLCFQNWGIVPKFNVLHGMWIWFWWFYLTKVLNWSYFFTICSIIKPV